MRFFPFFSSIKVSTDSCDVCTEIENNIDMDENDKTVGYYENITKNPIEPNTPSSPKQNVSFKLLTPVREESCSIKNSSDSNGESSMHSTWINNKMFEPNYNGSKPRTCCKKSHPPSPIQQSSSTQKTPGRKLAYPIQPPAMTSTFQKGGNLDDLLSDIENLSRDIYRMQLQNSRLMSKSNENIQQQRPDVLTNSVSMASLRSPNTTPKSGRKPYRSQVNLVLTQPSSVDNNIHVSHPPIGFEQFRINQTESNNQQLQPETNGNLEPPNYPPPPPIAPLTPEEEATSVLAQLSIDTANLRKEFIKTQSHSMNDDMLRPNLTIPPHSKDVTTNGPDKLKENKPNGVEKKSSLSTDSKHHSHNSAETGQTTTTDDPETPTKSDRDRKASVPNFFFRRRKKSKKNDDDFFSEEYMPAMSLAKPTTFRGTKNTRVARKNPAKDINNSVSTRYQRRMAILDSKNNKKHGRLSIDSNMMDGNGDLVEDSGASLLETSSRESSVSFRQRRLSSSSEGKKGDKIPWCACWGNGCY